MNKSEVLNTFTEREWELAKIYITKRLNDNNENFSFQHIGSQTIYFLDNIEKGFIASINKKAKKEYEEEEKKRKIEEEKNAKIAYFKTLSIRERLQQNFFVNWEDCEDDLRDEIRDKFIYERKRCPKSDNFLKDFQKNFHCQNIPTNILQEWLVIADEQYKNMGAYECWQHRRRFDWNCLSDDEKERLKKDLLFVGSTETGRCGKQYLVKNCGMPCEIYQEIMEKRKLLRKQNPRPRLSNKEFWEEMTHNLEERERRKYTLL